MYGRIYYLRFYIGIILGCEYWLYDKFKVSKIICFIVYLT